MITSQHSACQPAVAPWQCLLSFVYKQWFSFKFIHPVLSLPACVCWNKKFIVMHSVLTMESLHISTSQLFIILYDILFYCCFLILCISTFPMWTHVFVSVAAGPLLSAPPLPLLSLLLIDLTTDPQIGLQEQFQRGA